MLLGSNPHPQSDGLLSRLKRGAAACVSAASLAVTGAGGHVGAAAALATSAEPVFAQASAPASVPSAAAAAASQPRARAAVKPPTPRTAAAPNAGPAWTELSPAQQAALKPLASSWSTLDAPSKAKWIALGNRMPKMSGEEQTRVQARMAEWLQLPPKERGKARLQFQQAQTMSAEERRAKWQAYQQLSEEEKHKLSERAAARHQAAAASAGGARKPGAGASKVAAGSKTADGAKSNIVPQRREPQVKTVSPTIVQAQQGATTVLVSKRPPQPPAHLKPGQPKIKAPSAPSVPAAPLPTVKKANAVPRPAQVRTAASAPAASTPTAAPLAASAASKP